MSFLFSTPQDSLPSSTPSSTKSKAHAHAHAMPCHRTTHTLCEHALRPAATATDRDTGIPACMHTHHPGNYSWAREPVGFCRLRVEPSCHVRGSCPMQPTTSCPFPWSATSRPVRLLKIDFTDGALMLRIDDMVYLHVPLHLSQLLPSPSPSHELSWLRRGCLPSTSSRSCMSSAARLSLLTFVPPQLYDSHDSHDCGYLFVLLWHCMPHTKGTSACMHQMH